MREAIIQLVRGQHLNQAQASQAMELIMTGEATPAQIAAFLTALHLKGETDSEIAGMAAVMRAKAVAVPFDGQVVDTCGTGGDHSGTFNISTTAAFVAAGAGVTVAKHGNRAMSSTCGSADLLEGLGVNIELDAEGVARCLREAQIGFMFAPKFHPAMRFAGPVRREIGIRTVFNVLGPLTNPARARYQVLGVANAELAEKMAHALALLHTEHALVVHGNQVDELSLDGQNLIFEVRQQQVTRWEALRAADLGLQSVPLERLRGGSVGENVAITRAILTGTASQAHTDVVLLNAAAALVAADRVTSIVEGLQLARHSLSSGAAYSRMQSMVEVSQA
jgi:anthranilate phosphoribosyltransferase